MNSRGVLAFGRQIPSYTFARRCLPRGTTNARRGFTHAGATGANGLRFSGRLGRRRLRPGRYRLVATAIRLDGTAGRLARVRFRIVR